MPRTLRLVRAVALLSLVAVAACAGALARRPGPRTEGLEALVTGPRWDADTPEGARLPAFLVGGDVFAGATARPQLPRALAALAGAQLATLAASGAITTPCEAELWPSWDDWGRPTWVWARWRRAPGAPWRWFDLGAQPAADPLAAPRAIGPVVLDPSRPADRVALFTDALAQPDLYALPVAAGCVWTTASGEPVAGWPTADGAAALGQRALAEHWSCRSLPPPARQGDVPVVFQVGVHDGVIDWDPRIDWRDPGPAEPSVTAADVAAVTLPADLAARLLADVRMIDGEADATFADGTRQRFTRRSAALPDHQLGLLVDWLAQRSLALGVHSERVGFTWRGAAQADLIAVLPGELADQPVILADHLDTAFAEDTFAASGARVPVPGGDDNALATATLLAAAELLRDVPRRHPIWLVHLTGEEYPSDDLGARKLIAWMIARGTRPLLWLQLDMIGWRAPDDCVLQLSPSDHPRAGAAAALAATVARRLAPALCPVVRSPGDPRSYLYNTDGMTAAAAGIPTFLLNEHVNAVENLARHGYHDTADTAASIDPRYAADLAAIALVTAATLAR